MTSTVAEIHQYVQDKMKAGQENVLFGLESGDLDGAPERYLLDSPRGYWTRPDTEFPKEHSWHLFDTIREIVSGARHIVDIVTMDVPRGMLWSAVRTGLVAIARSEAPVTVRILIGNSAPNGVIKLEDLLKEIADDLATFKNRKLKIGIAQYRVNLAAGWGHAKFVAVDGKHLFQGGHNLWSEDYLYAAPIFDLSMRYDGPIAFGAHRFANALWQFVRKHPGGGHTWSFTMNEKLEIKAGVIGDVSVDPPRRTDPVPMLWVTNTGWGVFHDGSREVIDNSFVLAFEKAMAGGSWCRLSQQDLAATWRTGDKEFRVLDRTVEGLKDYPYDLLTCQSCFFIRPIIDAMANLLLKRDDTWIELVASPERKAGRGWTNKIPPSAIFNIVGNRMWVLSGHKLTKQRIFDKLSRQLYFGVVSFSGGRQTWPTDKTPKYNHAKFWMIDDVFYVGSENFYPSTVPALPPGLLQEFGVVAQATPAAKQAILDRYFQPMRDHSVKNVLELRHLTWRESDGEEGIAAAAG